MYKRILIIMGAGASKAASEEYPLINEFISKPAAKITRLFENNSNLEELLMQNDAFWKMLKLMDKFNLWKKDPETLPGNRMPEYPQASKSDYPDYRNSLLNYLRNIQSNSFRSGRINIEDVIGQIESMSLVQGSDEAKKVLDNYIVWLFAGIEGTNAFDYKYLPHSKLIAKLNEKGLLTQVAFLSFNYDTILERCLSNSGTEHNPLWNGLSGYGFEPEGYFDLGMTRHVNSRISDNLDNFPVVLKPHGSLGFTWINDHTYVPIAANGKVPEANQILGAVNEGTINSVIVPPGHIKRMHGKPTFEIWKYIRSGLRQFFDTIVVIGWNVPDSDNDIRSRFVRYLDESGDYGPTSERSPYGQIKKVIVCDSNQPEYFFEKFSMMFMPEMRVVKLNDKFNSDAVDRIIESIQ